MRASSALSRPLLCGIDFSDQSRRALSVALVLAKQLGQPLTVVTVLHPLLAQAAELRFTPGQFTMDTARDLESFIASAAPGADWLPAVTHRVLVGDAAKELIAVAANEPVSILVVGTRGLGRAQQFWFGSTTATLLTTTTCLVLAVPDSDRAPMVSGGSAPRLAVERIVCGVDFDEPSRSAARVAFDLGRRLGLPVELIHAVRHLAVPESWEHIVESTEAEALAQARSTLEALVADLGERATLTVKSGVPPDVLIAEAAAGPAALLVLGLGGAAHRPGTTATRVLAVSDAPVLAVPPA